MPKAQPSLKRILRKNGGTEERLNLQDNAVLQKPSPFCDDFWTSMPFSFVLKEDLNKIELVHLGGYRAKIYDLKIVA